MYLQVVFFGTLISVTWSQANFLARPLKGNGEFFKSFLFQKYERDQDNYLKIVLSQAAFVDPSVDFTQWPLLLVIRRHKRSHAFFASNFSEHRNRAVRLSPICFFRRDASTDMQHDPSGLKRDLTWPWPEVKIWLWLFKVKMHIFRRTSTRGTRWRTNYFVSSLSSKFICEKPFLLKTSFWPFLTSTA